MPVLCPISNIILYNFEQEKGEGIHGKINFVKILVLLGIFEAKLQGWYFYTLVIK